MISAARNIDHGDSSRIPGVADFRGLAVASAAVAGASAGLGGGMGWLTEADGGTGADGATADGIGAGWTGWFAAGACDAAGSAGRGCCADADATKDSIISAVIAFRIVLNMNAQSPAQ
jgi:hypothetical protein